jgi:hypothetical protein
MIRGLGALLIIGASAVLTARAEDCPYAEYRFVKGTGLIEITTGFMERHPDSAARAVALEKQGIIVLEADTVRTISRAEQAGAHRIVTTIAMAPPAGHGEGGASSSVDLKVVMDGRTLVDCPLWNAYLGLERIEIDPARRFVTLLGHYRLIRFDGFESTKVVDEDWLTARAREVEQLLIKGPSPFR